MDAKAVSKLGIRYVKEGPPELVRTLNDIINGLDRLYPETSTDISAAVTAQGTTLKLRGRQANPAQKAADVVGTLWKVTDTTSSGTAKVTLGYGSIDDHVPTASGTALSASPELTLAAGTWLYVLTLEIDANWDFVSAIVTMESTMPTSSPATKGYIKLAEIVSTGSAISSITPIITSSLRHMMCGNTDHLFWSVI